MIVIIGAGLAGLAAGEKLTASGHREFIIVEAQNCVGGRAKRAEMDYCSIYHAYKCCFSFCAKWFHNNPIYQRLQFVEREVGYNLDDTENVLFATQDGKRAPMDLVGPILRGALEAARMYSDLAKSSRTKLSIQETLDRIAEHCCANTRANEEELEIMRATKKWFELRECIRNSCANFSDLSTRVYVEHANCDKIKKLGLIWESLATRMAQSIGAQRIYLNSPVDHVEYSSDCVKVILVNGMTIDCDHALITIPVGALRRTQWRESAPLKTTSFIEPKLEPERQQMLDRVGFGPATKILLRFEKPLKKRFRGLKLLWTQEPSEVELPEWTKDLACFDPVPHCPSYLLAWVGRAGSLEAEKCSDSEIGEICCKLLKTFMPDGKIPKLIEAKMTRCSTNPYIGGAYSYPSVQEDQDCSRLTWEPICMRNSQDTATVPRILFAGEATAGEMCGTAMGAVASGWREANRLLELAQTKPKSKASVVNKLT